MPRYSQQSPYPTGRAPLAFDLSEQMWNIAQQRIQNRKQEIEEQQKQISENEAILLTALDFETVKGAQDKFAADMATRIDQMTNKWSERMKAKGGILDTNDKLELLRDKRDIETRIQVGAADVAQFQQLQKDLADPKKRGFYDFTTYANMAQYAKENKIGTGGAINLPVMKPQPWGEDFMAMAEQDANKLLLDSRQWSSIPNGVDDFGNTKSYLTNKPIVDNYVESLRQTPEYQTLYEENPQQAEALLESFKGKYYREPSQPVKPVRQAGSARSSGSPTYSQRKAEETKSAKIQEFGNIAQGLADMDENTVSLIKTSDFGGVSDIYYDTKDGVDYMYVDFQPTQGGDVKPTEEIKLPTTDEEKKIFYKKVWSVLPKEMQAGVSLEQVERAIRPPKENVKKVERVSITALKQNLDAAAEKPTNDNIKKLVTVITDLFPNVKVKANTPIIGANSVTIIDADGKSTDYNFKDKAKVEEFRIKINELIGGAKPPKTNTEPQAQKPKVVPSMFQ